MKKDLHLVERAAEVAGFIALREENHWRVYAHPTEIVTACDPESLKDLLFRLEAYTETGGEAAGFFAYEAGFALEPRLHPLLKERAQPLAWFGLYDRCEIIQGELGRETAQSETEGLQLAIEREEYCAKIEEIRGLIAEGEIYQLNFTDHLNFKFSGRPWELFAQLCAEHPTPYAAFMNTGTEQVVSLSPELFFRLQDDRIAVEPMKGTAPRGVNLEEDKIRAMELQQSEKERAENVMIVDLMRSDLGRICKTGSVRVAKLFEAKRFPSLWQMTSTIEGELFPDWTLDAVIRALFPSGSVTGAPKIRAMEHIARLERSRRGIYTGSIGYVAQGKAQFNVAIRTSVLRGRQGIMGVGSGITYDSSPDREWEECGWKCGFLTRRTPDFRLFETILWQDGYTLLDRHMERMASSAEYFGFAFDRHKSLTCLGEAATDFATGERWRVRLSLDRDGRLEANKSVMTEERWGRVMISEKRTSSTDRFLFHKTTQRQMYDQELEQARLAGCDDALFLNERGELTEGAIHNVFLLRDGVWQTPTLQCGLLPGTYRAKFLGDHPDAREGILRRDDLLQADAIFLCNSLRGIYEVQLAAASVNPVPQAVCR